jgi:hypothetical protein
MKQFATLTGKKETELHKTFYFKLNKPIIRVIGKNIILLPFIKVQLNLLSFEMTVTHIDINEKPCFIKKIMTTEISMLNDLQLMYKIDYFNANKRGILPPHCKVQYFTPLKF